MLPDFMRRPPPLQQAPEVEVPPPSVQAAKQVAGRASLQRAQQRHQALMQWSPPENLAQANLHAKASGNSSRSTSKEKLVKTVFTRGDRVSVDGCSGVVIRGPDGLDGLYRVRFTDFTESEPLGASALQKINVQVPDLKAALDDDSPPQSPRSGGSRSPRNGEKKAPSASGSPRSRRQQSGSFGASASASEAQLSPREAGAPQLSKVRVLCRAAGGRMGRTTEEMDKVAEVLEANWFDTPASLYTDLDESVARELGIPEDLLKGLRGECRAFSRAAGAVRGSPGRRSPSPRQNTSELTAAAKAALFAYKSVGAKNGSASSTSKGLVASAPRLQHLPVHLQTPAALRGAQSHSNIPRRTSPPNSPPLSARTLGQKPSAQRLRPQTFINVGNGSNPPPAAETSLTDALEGASATEADAYHRHMRRQHHGREQKVSERERIRISHNRWDAKDDAYLHTSHSKRSTSATIPQAKTSRSISGCCFSATAKEITREIAPRYVGHHCKDGELLSVREHSPVSPRSRIASSASGTLSPRGPSNRSRPLSPRGPSNNGVLEVAGNINGAV